MGDRVCHAGLFSSLSPGLYRGCDPRYPDVLAIDRLLVWRHRPGPACPMLPQDRRAGTAYEKKARWSSIKVSTVRQRVTIQDIFAATIFAQSTDSESVEILA